MPLAILQLKLLERQGIKISALLSTVYKPTMPKTGANLVIGTYLFTLPLAGLSEISRQKRVL
jgi:hypothetical protein